MKKILLSLMLISTVVSANNNDVYVKSIIDRERENKQNATEAFEKAYSEIGSGLNDEYGATMKEKPTEEELFGTWYLSYSIGTSNYNDKMELNSIFVSDSGGRFARGSVYQGNNYIFKTEIICGSTPSNVSAALGAKYLCITVSNNSLNHYFAISIQGDEITNGYYSIGTTDSAISILVDRRYPITGYRQPKDANINPAPIPVISSRNQYINETNELELPEVFFNGRKYRVVLKNVGGFVFHLEQVEKLN